MVDIRAISRTAINKTKVVLFGKGRYGSKQWTANPKWYEQIHQSQAELHRHFQSWLATKADARSVLEIGCGTGSYPVLRKYLFGDLDYTGVDISPTCIDYCTKHSDFKFRCGDLLEMEFDDTYDIVFSHAVIDHVADPNTFLRKAVSLSRRWAYISAYREVREDLPSHKINWNEQDRCYYNDLTEREIVSVLAESGLANDEFWIHRASNDDGCHFTVVVKRV